MKVKKKAPKSQQDGPNEDDEYGDDYQERQKWYEQIAPDPKDFPPVTDQILIELKDEAKKCLDSEAATYNIKNAKTNPDYRWMKTVMSKGTVSDKIAAYTVLIQDNPVCCLETIQNLVGMVKVGKKKECIAVIETLSELFLSDLLRPDVKLKPFHARPLSRLADLSSGNAVTRRKYLSRWYFEDQLKETYVAFVGALNKAAHDTVDSNKEKAIAAMCDLLAGNPEQEKNLLANVVNKLGDPSQKVASKTMYCLTRLLSKHPNMQAVVLKEIERLLFRQNVGHKAQYYSLCFLTQMYLSHEYANVARKLIELYFSFFKKCVKEGDVDSRMMSALLTGVNRAYPYAGMELDKISEHIDTMYKIVHIANFNVGLHALLLLYQVSSHSDAVNDRFYSAFYRKLLDPAVKSTTNHTMLLNLVYKSLARDTDGKRIAAFLKRLLQLCQHVQPNFACGILYLTSQILHKRPDVALLELRKTIVDDDEDDDGEEKYPDVSDENIEIIDCEEDREHEVQPKHESDEEDVKPDVEALTVNMAKASSWYHCDVDKKTSKHYNSYNPAARNPLFAGAEHSAYSELLHLRNHYHPSVALFAENVLKNEKITYSGDPLKDFTLIRFLDRFVFKNPKRPDEQAPSLSTFGKRKLYKPTGLRNVAVTSSNYLNEEEHRIPVEELFMFSYLKQKYKDGKVKEEDEDDLESVASEEFEDMLSKMSDYKGLDEDIDYMNEIGTSLQKKKDKKKGREADEEDEEEHESESDDEDNIDELSEDDGAASDEDPDADLTMNDEDRDLLEDVDEDEDEDIMFESDEEGERLKSRIKKRLGGEESVFASAEEFAALLEEEGAATMASGTSSQLSNKDRADVKQLNWEVKRDRWIKGYNKAVGKRGRGDGDKSFSKKRSNSTNIGGKKKRFKKK